MRAHPQISCEENAVLEAKSRTTALGGWWALRKNWQDPWKLATLLVLSSAIGDPGSAVSPSRRVASRIALANPKDGRMASHRPQQFFFE